LESVFRQTYPDYEVFVVDDGSIDDTKAVLDPYIQSGKITYIYQENAGCGAARNNGIKQSAGDYIALLDADDYWHNEKLKMQMDVFKKYPETIVCYTESYIIDPYSDLVWETKRDTINAQRSGKVLPFLVFHNMLTLSSVLTRREALEKVGGFTEQYELMMVADLDLWLRLAPQGMFYAITTPLTFYQTRSGITESAICENHRQIALVFFQNKKNTKGFVWMCYTLGWFRASMLHELYKAQIIPYIKKMKNTLLK
jgi:glycosyltransferase involved in cell wall biosynthesis